MFYQKSNEYLKNLNYFIQINIENESQKSGIPFNEVDAFYDYCKRKKKFKCYGLMVIPPE